MGTDPDFDLTILSLAPNPGAGTMALISGTRKKYHIPSIVVSVVLFHLLHHSLILKDSRLLSNGDVLISR